ncbi:G-patch domain-containing protein [Coccidioides immitis RS]|uniref:G-patch domain-containing protein n=3 Tax=Coccidioides immitis TaxID=5501 RepID=A0A0E1RZ33_COCIM|nr:G-patch domain-containing protein [Coccidioides immitis RS]EAS36875.1 G-patch domain-containing protein [Coccidioides immitis RS]KMP09789.1 hypothetical protein CIRG_09022 [Coccidioides immitis RMSCC 2394]KMU90241.1 hypothetical protein CIHG_08051 [Coccidioides immitis H538.4]TPX25065.1 hypothetical protein DIZ76_010514 [Coccidioides immitis]
MLPKPAWLEEKSTPKDTQDDDDEEDYMSMAILEPPQPSRAKETYTQRCLRKQRESEAKARVPSKAELAAAEAARRDEALAKSTLDPSNKGFQMMARLGYKPGTALGKDYSAEHPSGRNEWNRRITEPLSISVKEDRGGIGMDTEKKRKFREEVEEEAKKVKTEQVDFRERVRLEREARRAEAQFHAAQKVAERLDTESEEKQQDPVNAISTPTAEEKANGGANGANPDDANTKKRPIKRISQINILYRGLARAREEKVIEDQAQRRRYESLSSRDQSFFSRNAPGLPTYNDTDLDTDDKLALGRNAEGDIVEVECDLEEDPELEEFNALSPQEQLTRIVAYLREKHNYCFWCKYRYETPEMDGCPGVTEEQHD